MWKKRLTALVIFLLGLFIAFFVYTSETKKPILGIGVPKSFEQYSFKLGLDLKGGSQLTYKAKTDNIAKKDLADSMNALRDVIERRVNLFGVSEPVVSIVTGSIGDDKLIVELPGVTDINEAVATIGDTPTLEFKTERPEGAEKEAMKKKIEDAQKIVQDAVVGPDGSVNISPNVTQKEIYAVDWVETKLNGLSIKNARLEFNQTTGEPVVGLEFTTEGADLFAKITEANVGKRLAIFLDGSPISAPNINEAIRDGRAQISGNFTQEEAKTLVGRLNSGALPINIELVSTETIGPTLGEKAIQAGVFAGMIGFLAIVVFLLFWYRFSGLLASIALSIYVAMVLAVFKLMPVTLTASGIAGFIISLGIAVDANVLIFERLKEEIRKNRTVNDAIKIGFTRAWSSIRDSNTSTLISALILFWFGTSLIKGFALTLGIGVICSMVSAIIITRLFMYAFYTKGDSKFKRFIFSSGLSTGRPKTN